MPTTPVRNSNFQILFMYFEYKGQKLEKFYYSSNILAFPQYKEKKWLWLVEHATDYGLLLGNVGLFWRQQTL